MIPHMSSAPFSAPAGRNPVRKHIEPGYIGPTLRRGGSAELLDYERGDPSTEGFGLWSSFCLGENPYERLGTRGPNEHATLPFQVVVHLLDAVEQGLRQRSRPIPGGVWFTRGERPLDGAGPGQLPAPGAGAGQGARPKPTP